MAVFPIRTFGDPVLRTPAADVPIVDEAVLSLVGDMMETMIAAPGVGLAAPQIGILKRVIVWKTESGGGALVNPRIVSQSGSALDDEACLSLPGLAYPVERATHVVVGGIKPSGEEVTFESEGFDARVLQHEIDHLDGVLFIDRLAPVVQKEAKRKLREQALAGTSVAPAATRF